MTDLQIKMQRVYAQVKALADLLEDEDARASTKYVLEDMREIYEEVKVMEELLYENGYEFTIKGMLEARKDKKESE